MPKNIRQMFMDLSMVLQNEQGDFINIHVFCIADKLYSPSAILKTVGYFQQVGRNTVLSLSSRYLRKWD